MGTLPSREAHEHPASFYFAFSGVYAVAMLPVTPHFFPSSTCLAFQQLYASRDQQSSKYHHALRVKQPNHRGYVFTAAGDHDDELSEKPRPYLLRSESGNVGATTTQSNLQEYTVTRPGGGIKIRSAAGVEAIDKHNYSLFFSDDPNEACGEDVEPRYYIPGPATESVRVLAGDRYSRREAATPSHVDDSDASSGAKRADGCGSYDTGDRWQETAEVSYGVHGEVFGPDSLYHELVRKPCEANVVDTNAQMCSIYGEELRWIKAREVVCRYRRQLVAQSRQGNDMKVPKQDSEPLVTAEEASAAEMVPAPSLFLRPCSQAFIIRMSSHEEEEARRAYFEAHPELAAELGISLEQKEERYADDAVPRGSGSGDVSPIHSLNQSSPLSHPSVLCKTDFRFTRNEAYKDGRLHLVEEDGVVYLFAYNPACSSSQARPLSSVAGDTTETAHVGNPSSGEVVLTLDEQPKDGLNHRQDSTYTVASSFGDADIFASPRVDDLRSQPITDRAARETAGSSNGENDSDRNEHGVEVVGTLSQTQKLLLETEAEFVLPICPVRVVGCRGVLEASFRGTPWLRGLEDELEEDTYRETCIARKPPVLRAWNFVDTSIGDKILSRAYLIGLQTFRSMCLAAGLPDSLVRPISISEILSNIPMLHLFREVRFRVRASAAEVERGEDALRCAIKDTDNDLRKYISNYPSLSWSLLKGKSRNTAAVETDHNKEKGLGSVNPHLDSGLSLYRRIAFPRHKCEFSTLLAIRGSRICCRLRADAQRTFFHVLSEATAPFSVSQLMLPLDTTPYNYGGTVRMHALLHPVTNKEERQVLPPPRNLEAMQCHDDPTQATNGASLEDAEHGAPAEEESGNQEPPILVYVVVEPSPQASGPSAQHYHKNFSAQLDHVNDGVTESSGVSARSQHQYMYPAGYFVDGDMVVYDNRKGVWQHFEAYHAMRMKGKGLGPQDGEATPYVGGDETRTADCAVATTTVTEEVRLEDILLCWIKCQLDGAHLRCRSNPGWLLNQNRSVLQVGRYCIWSFIHDGQRFYYGVIPKFIKRIRPAVTNKSVAKHPSRPLAAHTAPLDHPHHKERNNSQLAKRTLQDSVFHEVGSSVAHTFSDSTPGHQAALTEGPSVHCQPINHPVVPQVITSFGAAPLSYEVSHQQAPHRVMGSGSRGNNQTTAQPQHLQRTQSRPAPLASDGREFTHALPRVYNSSCVARKNGPMPTAVPHSQCNTPSVCLREERADHVDRCATNPTTSCEFTVAQSTRSPYHPPSPPHRREKSSSLPPTTTGHGMYDSSHFMASGSLSCYPESLGSCNQVPLEQPMAQRQRRAMSTPAQGRPVNVAPYTSFMPSRSMERHDADSIFVGTSYLETPQRYSSNHHSNVRNRGAAPRVTKSYESSPLPATSTIRSRHISHPHSPSSHLYFNYHMAHRPVTESHGASYSHATSSSHPSSTRYFSWDERIISSAPSGTGNGSHSTSFHHPTVAMGTISSSRRGHTSSRSPMSQASLHHQQDTYLPPYASTSLESASNDNNSFRRAGECNTYYMGGDVFLSDTVPSQHRLLYNCSPVSDMPRISLSTSRTSATPQRRGSTLSHDADAYCIPDPVPFFSDQHTLHSPQKQPNSSSPPKRHVTEQFYDASGVTSPDQNLLVRHGVVNEQAKGLSRRLKGNGNFTWDPYQL